MLTYQHTRFACYISFISQAITASLPPLLFTVFYDRLGMTLPQIASVIFAGFIAQLFFNLLSLRFIDSIGYRTAAIAAHMMLAIGMILLGILPILIQPHYAGFLIAVIVYSIGAGLIEVLISPMIDYLPSKRKSSQMSLLHSCYSCGAAGTILFSTVMLRLLDDELWFVLPILLSLIPLFDIFLYLRVPIANPPGKHEKLKIRQLFQTPFFIVLLLIMVCAGASEQIIFQWASFFSENALHLPKLMGDLIGPFAFTVLMGAGRIWYGFWGNRFSLTKVLGICGFLCSLCYAVIAFAGNPLLSVMACGLCGIGASMMWPGAISLSSSAMPMGGTAMFGLLAMSGILGGSLGTWIVGNIGDYAGLKTGFAVGMIFPVTLLVCFIVLSIRQTQTGGNKSH